MNQFSNLSLIFIFICILIIVINVFGGSIVFKEQMKFSFNKAIYGTPPNAEAFKDSNELAKLLEKENNTDNKETKMNENKESKMNENKETKMNENKENNNMEHFSIQTNNFSNSMNDFKPFNSNNEKNNIQSNLINVCNQTEKNFNSLLKDE